MNTEPKYRLTEVTNEIQLAGSMKKFKVHRIQALKELTHFKRKHPVIIRPGDLGGWVESEQNLSQEGECWIGDEAVAFMNGRVEGDAYVTGTAAVFGNAIVKDTALIRGDAEIFDEAIICEYARIWGNGAVGGSVIISGQAVVHNHGRVTGEARISGKAKVIQNGSVTGSARISDNATIGGSAHVGGNAEIGGWTVINGNADLRVGIYSGGSMFVPPKIRWLTVGPVQRVPEGQPVWVTLQVTDKTVNCERFSGNLEQFQAWAKSNLMIDPFNIIVFFKSQLSYLSFNQ